MADGIIQVAVDSTGKKVDTSELTVGANTVERQRIVIADNSNAAAFANVFPSGHLRVFLDPSQLFYDAYDAALDTVVKWNTAVAAGGGSAATVSAGVNTLALGTTLNGYTYLTSRPTFASSTPGWIRFAHNITLEYPINASTYRAWGGGKPVAVPSNAGFPSPTNVFTDAAVFEVSSDGKMYAAVYQGSVRSVVQDLSVATGNSAQPANNATHNYEVWYRPTRIYWFIDSVLVATSSLVQSALAVDAIPNVYLGVQGGTTATSLISNATSVSDSGRNAQSQCDGQYPWVKQSIRPVTIPATNADMAASIRIDNSNKATYILSATGQANTAAGQSVAIEAGAAKTVRIRKIAIMQVGTQTSAAFRTLTIKRTTAAGSSGAVTPAPCDTSDAAYTGICRAKGTDGTAGTTLFTFPFWVPTAAANAQPLLIWPPATGVTEADKDLTIAAGTANGIAVDDSGAAGGANFAIMVVFTEE
jgi:hypothetical protein